MDEITEYKELLRDWQISYGFLIVVTLALCMILAVYTVSPVYYQFNMIMTITIFIAALVVCLLFVLLRCQELGWSISALKQEEEQTQEEDEWCRYCGATKTAEHHSTCEHSNSAYTEINGTKTND